MENARNVALVPGQVLANKYRVERIIGQGGFGVVVAAHHLQLDERVAIKVLLPEIASRPDAVARFLREGRATIKIRSEHVVRVLDVGTLESGAPFLVMEYLEGQDLAALLARRGPLAPWLAVDHVLQACEALAEAHALGIVHRDLKPANLFLTQRRDGTTSIKVLDFGISKVTRPGEQGMTSSGVLVGSPRYMSPEQMRSARQVDARTDIWSLGVITYELVCGRAPFDATSFPELFAKVTSHAPPAMRSWRADVTSGLDAAIAKCLEKDPARRYADVALLAAALAPFGGAGATTSAQRIQRVLGAPIVVRSPDVAIVSGDALTVTSAPPPPPNVGTVEGVGVSVAASRTRRFPTIALLGPALLVGGVALYLALASRAVPSGAASSHSGDAVVSAEPSRAAPRASQPVDVVVDAAVASSTPSASSTPTASTPPRALSNASARPASASAAPPPPSSPAPPSDDKQLFRHRN